MGHDIEDDWARLGRGPTRTVRTLRQGTKFLEYLISLAQRFLEYLISIIARAWNGLFRTLSDPARIGGLVSLTALVLLSWFAWNSFKSDGRIIYCFVNQTSNRNFMELVGYRPWHPNATLRSIKDGEPVEILYKTAKDLDCPLR